MLVYGDYPGYSRIEPGPNQYLRSPGAQRKELIERKKIRKRWPKANTRFHTIYDSVNDAIFVHNLETGASWMLISVCAKMYGYTRQEASSYRLKT